MGTVYAAPDSGYYQGWTANKKNELGYNGEYLITGQKLTGVAASDYGKVYVNRYYDGDASKLPGPVNTPGHRRQISGQRIRLYQDRRA